MSPDEVPVTTRYRHFIDGAAVEGQGAEHMAVHDPVTGGLIEWVALGTEEDVDRAVVGAHAAQQEWKRTGPEQRARVLRRIGDGLISQLDAVADIESRNAGKSLADAREEVVAAAELFYFYSGVATQRYGLQVPMPDEGLLCYTVREPVGVVAAITPWNYPLVIASGKIASALCVGCAVVAKPAPETPLTTILLARLAFEAGLPPGVLNVVTGDDRTGAALVRHRLIDKVSFTGSTTAGRSVASAAAVLGRPVVMELGGKSPNIVFDDVEVSAVVGQVLMAGLTNGGQDCCSGSRILVQETIAEEFRSAAARWLSRLEIGPSDGSGTHQINPIISERQRERVSGLVDRALAEGAEILARREAPNDGFFYPPTILTKVGPTMEICRTEIFGPVLTIETFTDADDAIAKGNDTPYGLAAGVWTSDIGRAMKCAEELDAGRLWVNSYMTETPSAPWGGMKDSGYGSEMGAEGALEFTVTRVVYMRGIASS